MVTDACESTGFVRGREAGAVYCTGRKATRAWASIAGARAVECAEHDQREHVLAAARVSELRRQGRVRTYTRGNVGDNNLDLEEDPEETEAEGAQKRQRRVRYRMLIGAEFAPVFLSLCALAVLGRR
jgi:hypothetical protein